MWDTCKTFYFFFQINPHRHFSQTGVLEKICTRFPVERSFKGLWWTKNNKHHNTKINHKQTNVDMIKIMEFFVIRVAEKLYLLLAAIIGFEILDKHCQFTAYFVESGSSDRPFWRIMSLKQNFRHVLLCLPLWDLHQAQKKLPMKVESAVYWPSLFSPEVRKKQLNIKSHIIINCFCLFSAWRHVSNISAI